MRPRWTIGTFLRTFVQHGMPHFENNFATRGAPILSPNVLRDYSELDPDILARECRRVGLQVERTSFFGMQRLGAEGDEHLDEVAAGGRGRSKPSLLPLRQRSLERAVRLG